MIEQLKNFKIVFVLILITFLFGLFISLSSQAQVSKETCDAIYEQRAEKLDTAYKALSCYQEFSKTHLNDESLYLSAAWIYFHETQKDKKIELVKVILESLNKVEDPKVKNYWIAAYTTFKSILMDEGKRLPYETFKNLNKIKTLLKSAQLSNPSQHRFGPSRTLGIMYLQMPAIVGGSDQLAKENLEFALKSDPDFCLNKIWLAKLYLKIGDKEKSKSLLKDIVDLKEDNFEKEWIPETKEIQIEAAEIIKTQKL